MNIDRKRFVRNRLRVSDEAESNNDIIIQVEIK
jgi:hypothetical protein